MLPLKPGQVVKSLAGRDKGTFYFVIEVAGDYAKVIDGDKRPVSKPKRKNRKHIQALNHVSADAAEALKQDKLTDALVKNLLEQWQQENELEEKEVW